MSEETEPPDFRIPVHQSLLRPKLALGAEPTLVYISAGICGLAFATGEVKSYALGALSWTGILFVLRWIAKNVDPRAFDLYVRATNYRSFISAQPSIVASRPPSHQLQ